MTEIIEGQMYKHSSGMKYRIKKILFNATGYEKGNDIVKMILYVQLDSGKFPSGTIWVREENDFKENFKLIQ